MKSTSMENFSEVCSDSFGIEIINVLEGRSCSAGLADLKAAAFSLEIMNEYIEDVELKM